MGKTETASKKTEGRKKLTELCTVGAQAEAVVADAMAEMTDAAAVVGAAAAVVVEAAFDAAGVAALVGVEDVIFLDEEHQFRMVCGLKTTLI